MRGKVVTTIRATHEMDVNDPREIAIEAAVRIEPDQVTRSFGFLSRSFARNYKTDLKVRFTFAQQAQVQITAQDVRPGQDQVAYVL